MVQENLLTGKPNYQNGSIVNLMQSIIQTLNPSKKPGAGAYGELDIFPIKQSKKAKRVALIVVDGLGQDLYDILDHKKALSTWHVGTLTSVYPSTTASAISTFLTGSAPKQHGITGWYMYLPEISDVATILPFISRAKKEDLVQYGLDPLTLTNSESLTKRLGTESTVIQPAEISDSAFSRSMGQGAIRQSYKSYEEFSSLIKGFVCGNTDSSYLYGYIPTIDSTAHHFGPYSLETKVEYEKVSKLLSALFKLAEASDTMLITTADHGFIHSPPERRIYLTDHPEMKRMLSLPLCGEPRTAYAYVKEKARKRFAAYIKDNLNQAIEIEESEKFISSNWLGTGTPSNFLKDRVGDFVLFMKENYAIYDPLPNEMRPSLLGVHGGRSVSEINVPLFVSGPSN